VTGPLRDPGPEAQRIVGEMADAAGGPAPGEPGATAPGPGDVTQDAERPVEPLPDAAVGEVEEWSLDQLHRRASEVGLEGRWDMTRDELVAALREP
jgi:hypothetical protein